MKVDAWLEGLAGPQATYRALRYIRARLDAHFMELHRTGTRPEHNGQVEGGEGAHGAVDNPVADLQALLEQTRQLALRLNVDLDKLDLENAVMTVLAMALAFVLMMRRRRQMAAGQAGTTAPMQQPQAAQQD